MAPPPEQAPETVRCTTAGFWATATTWAKVFPESFLEFGATTMTLFGRNPLEQIAMTFPARSAGLVVQAMVWKPAADGRAWAASPARPSMTRASVATSATAGRWTGRTGTSFRIEDRMSVLSFAEGGKGRS